MANTDSTLPSFFSAGIVVENDVITYQCEGEMSAEFAGAAASALNILANGILAEAREGLYAGHQSN